MQISPPSSPRPQGLDAFIAYVSEQAVRAPRGWSGAAWFILQLSEECAGIRLQDMWQLPRFLHQLVNVPPRCFGAKDFNPRLVDDLEPARHYVAFVFVGFWLPRWLALLVLYAWEVAGFARYRGQWSQRDVNAGLIGLRHGRWVAALGPTVLPALIASELSAA